MLEIMRQTAGRRQHHRLPRPRLDQLSRRRHARRSDEPLPLRFSHRSAKRMQRRNPARPHRRGDSVSKLGPPALKSSTKTTVSDIPGAPGIKNDRSCFGSILERKGFSRRGRDEYVNFETDQLISHCDCRSLEPHCGVSYGYCVEITCPLKRSFD
jgi:hypothetical protein